MERRASSVCFCSFTEAFNARAVITTIVINACRIRSDSLDESVEIDREDKLEKGPLPFIVPATAITEQSRTAVIVSCCLKRIEAHTTTGMIQKAHLKI